MWNQVRRRLCSLLAVWTQASPSPHVNATFLSVRGNQNTPPLHCGRPQSRRLERASGWQVLGAFVIIVTAVVVFDFNVTY